MNKAMNKLQQLFTTSRPVSWINTAYPFAAGYIISTGQIDVRLIIGTLFYLIPYNLLLYGVNDVYDYESDIRNPRKGGIEGAKLHKSSHHFILQMAYSCSLPFVVYLLYAAPSSLNRLILIANLVLALAYSLPKLRFKERPLIDSMTSSSHFVLPLVFALSFAPYQAADGLVIASFFLWGMASHAFGAVQDINADRQAHIGSIATASSARAAVRLSIGLYVASALLLLPFRWLGAIVAITELIYIANVWPYRDLSDALAESSNAGWRRFISLNQLMGAVVTMVLLYGHLHGR